MTWKNPSRAHLINKFEGTALPKKAPRFNVVAAEPCPDCKAPVGTPCFSLITGEYKSVPHISRRRIALRNYYKQKEADNG